MFWLFFRKNDCQYDGRNDVYGFIRFPSVAIFFDSFWGPIQLIVLIKLRVLVVFSEEWLLIR